ncbi:MAG: pyridoxamine 5'-phosphate oxidase family protein [Clostridia bacterium]
MRNRKMSAGELKEHIKVFLKEHKEGSLATCLNGMPRSSPVQYFADDNLNIYILSAGGEKFNAIHQNPNVCLLVNTNYITYKRIKGVQIFGKVTSSIENLGLFDEAKRQYPESYMMDHERHQLKVIKIVPDEIVYLDSTEDGDRTKQILKNNEVIIKEDPMLLPR